MDYRKALALVGFFTGLAAVAFHMGGATGGADWLLGICSAVVFATYGWVSLRRS